MGEALAYALAVYGQVWPVWTVLAGILVFIAVYDWSNGR